MSAGRRHGVPYPVGAVGSLSTKIKIARRRLVRKNLRARDTAGHVGPISRLVDGRDHRRRLSGDVAAERVHTIDRPFYREHILSIARQTRC